MAKGNLTLERAAWARIMMPKTRQTSIGSMVKVAVPFKSNNRGPKREMHFGCVGIVIFVDEDEDLQVDFGCYGIHWVKSSHSDRLMMAV